MDRRRIVLVCGVRRQNVRQVFLDLVFDQVHFLFQKFQPGCVAIFQLNFFDEIQNLGKQFGFELLEILETNVKFQEIDKFSKKGSLFKVDIDFLFFDLLLVFKLLNLLLQKLKRVFERVFLVLRLHLEFCENFCILLSKFFKFNLVGLFLVHDLKF